MSTRTFYHPRDMAVDLADLPKWLYDEIASMHGHIAPPPAPPVLTCLGNGEPMYVYHHSTGRYFARHYPGGNPSGHQHQIATISDEHRRQVEYSQRAASEHGLNAEPEVSTGNGTRLDLAIRGDLDIGFEIQRSGLSRAQAKTRATKSYDAGWPTAWITDREHDPDWADHVPTARLSTRGGWDLAVPPRNSAKVIISQFGRERDRKSRSGYRYVRTPCTVLLDELAVLMPAGEIVPVAVGRKGAVMLATKGAQEVIDSCTYRGASEWRPRATTPREREVVQRYSTECHAPTLGALPDPERLCASCGLSLGIVVPATQIRHFDCQRRHESGGA